MTPLAADGPRFELTDERDFLRLCWNPGIVMELDDVQASVAAVLSLSAESPPSACAIGTDEAAAHAWGRGSPFSG